MMFTNFNFFFLVNFLSRKDFNKNICVKNSMGCISSCKINDFVKTRAQNLEKLKKNKGKICTFLMIDKMRNKFELSNFL